MQTRLGALAAVVAVTLIAFLLSCGEAWAAGLATVLVELPWWAGWAVACYGAGRWFTGPGVFGEAAGFAVGYGAIGTSTMLLGLGGLLGVGGYGLLGCGVLAAGAQLWPRREAVAAWWRRPAGVAWLGVPVGAAWGVMLAAAVVLPGVLWGDEPHGYDVASYHLQLPREWFEAGRVSPTGHNVFGFFPLLVEMHYLLAMHVRGGAYEGMYLAKLTHAATVLALPAVVTAGLWDRDARGAIAAGVLVGVVPWAVLLGGVAYNEGGLMLFTATAVLAALRGRYLVAGLAVGFGCGCKYTGVPILLLGVPALVLIVGGRFVAGGWEAVSVRRSLGNAAVVAGVGVLAFAPWWVRNLVWTGNPVFPQLTGVLPVEGWDEVLRERWRLAHSAQATDSAVGRLWTEVLGRWWYGFALIPAGLIGAVIAAAATDTRRLGVGLLLFVGGTMLFWLTLTHLQARFLTVLLPVFTIAAVASGRRWTPYLAGGAATVCLAVTLLTVPAKLAPYRSAVGVLDPAVLLTERPAVVEALRRAETTGRPVRLVGDAQAFFYPGDVRYTGVFNVRGDDLLAGYGVEAGDVVIVNTPELRRFERTYHGFPAVDPRFAGEFVLPADPAASADLLKR